MKDLPMQNQNYVIIVAGGSGSRMQTDTPKQFLLLHHQPVLMHSIRSFYSFDPGIHIIVVLPEKEINTWKELCNSYAFDIAHEIVAGGDTRFQSVKNGLTKVKQKGLVAVHDGVRPFASPDTLQRCFEMAAKKGNALPVIDTNESVRKINKNNNRAVDRTQYKQVQTPQVFKTEMLREAYSRNYTPLYTDDASVVEEVGYRINLVQGNAENMKITNPADLVIAEAIMTYLNRKKETQTTDNA